MQRLPGWHAPVMLAILHCTVLLRGPLTGTIVRVNRGGRAWLCHWRGVALGLTVAVLLPNSSTIDQPCYWRSCCSVSLYFLLFCIFPLSLIVLFLLLDATVPARNMVMGFEPAFRRCCTVFFCMNFEVTVSRYKEKHGEFRKRDRRGDGW